MLAVDHLVIGGGVTGAAVAWQLAEQGQEVLVLEAATVAAGASGGPGKRGVRANGRDPRELPLMVRAYELWPALAEAIGHATGYERTGQLWLTERADDVSAFAAATDAQNRAGIPSELVEGTRLYELEPELSERVVAAVFCPLDGVADHTATTTGLADAARRAGAEVREGEAAVELRAEGSRLRVLTAKGELIEAGTTVVAANMAVADLLAPLGVRLPVVPVFPQVVVTAPLPHVHVRRLSMHAHRPLSVKALPGEEVMITGGRLGRWDEDAGRAAVDPGQIDKSMADAVAVYPALAGAGVALAVADRVESYCADGIPIIDRVPGTEHAFFATGWSGHGWAIAPVVAELLVDWVGSGVRPGALAPLGLDRLST